MLRKSLVVAATVIGVSSTAAMADIDLVIDLITGEATFVSDDLVDTEEDPIGDELTAYVIQDPSSADPSLIEDNWVPLSSQGYGGWFTLPSSDVEIAEASLEDDDAAHVDATGISIGNIFNTDGDQDLVFFYAVAGSDQEIQGDVVYIPEPTTALAGLGAAGLMLMRRRR